MVTKNEEKWIDHNDPVINTEDRLLLIDADIMYYRAGFAVEEKFDFGEAVAHTADGTDAMHLFHRLLIGVLKNLNTTRFILCWSDTNNFRNSVASSYKENRNDSRSPCGGTPLKEALKMKYPSIQVPNLEADDLMGMNSGPGCIIVSDDKDLLTIPGLHYKPRKPELGVFHISANEAQAFWFQQILMGDRTDGYNGIPGIGEKKSEKILQKYGYTWLTILKAYEDNGLTASDALVTARLSRILHPGEWDYTLNSPILWSPTQ